MSRTDIITSLMISFNHRDGSMGVGGGHPPKNVDRMLDIWSYICKNNWSRHYKRAFLYIFDQFLNIF